MICSGCAKGWHERCASPSTCSCQHRDDALKTAFQWLDDPRCGITLLQPNGWHLSDGVLMTTPITRDAFVERVKMCQLGFKRGVTFYDLEENGVFLKSAEEPVSIPGTFMKRQKEQRDGQDDVPEV